MVPSALPTNDVFTQTVDLEEGELYAFTIVDTSGNGMQAVTEDSKSQACFCCNRKVTHGCSHFYRCVTYQ